jgi:hypothetical protein
MITYQKGEGAELSEVLVAMECVTMGEDIRVIPELVPSGIPLIEEIRGKAGR